MFLVSLFICPGSPWGWPWPGLAGRCGCEDWAKPALRRDLGQLLSPSRVGPDSELCPVPGHQRVRSISTVGNVVFPPPKGPQSSWPCGVSLSAPTPRLHRSQQSVPIGPHAFICVVRAPSTPGAHRGPLPALVTAWRSPRCCSSEASWMPQPRARLEVSPPHPACTPHLQAFRSVKCEESTPPVLVCILASFC